MRGDRLGRSGTGGGGPSQPSVCGESTCDPRVDGLLFDTVQADLPTATGGLRRFTAREDDWFAPAFDIDFEAESTRPELLQVVATDPPAFSVRATGEGWGSIRLRATDSRAVLDRLTMEVARIDHVLVDGQTVPALLVGTSADLGVTLVASDGRSVVDEEAPQSVRVEAADEAGLQQIVIGAASTNWPIDVEFVEGPDDLGFQNLQGEWVDEMVLTPGQPVVFCGVSRSGERRVWGADPAIELIDPEQTVVSPLDVGLQLPPSCLSVRAEQVGETSARLTWGALVRERIVRVVEHL